VLPEVRAAEVQAGTVRAVQRAGADGLLSSMPAEAVPAG
jgi:hypothetical protein